MAQELRIVQNNNPHELAAEVNRLLAQGWELNGPTAHRPGPGDCFVQPLKRGEAASIQVDPALPAEAKA